MLIAEHDQELNLLIEPVLRHEGYEVSLAREGREVLRLIREERPDFIILDRMIPSMGGIQICKNIRKEPALSETPIIMLGANGDASERILAFNVGADDYLMRPFDMEELLARIKAMYRRQKPGKDLKILKAGPIEIDLGRWVTSVNNISVTLTVKEFRLLQELLEAKGRVLSRDILLERVWGHEKEYDLNTRTVDVHIGRLRNKLGRAGGYIITVRNVGYRVDVSPEWILHRNMQ